MTEVLVVGHVTRDVIGLPEQPDREQVGGSAYYSARALATLGRRPKVVTAWSAKDEPLMMKALAGISVMAGSSEQSTVFENRYRSASLSHREQRVLSVARSLTAADLPNERAMAAHVGPLTAAELNEDLLPALRSRVQTIALDVQGFLRTVREGTVHLGHWPEAAWVLSQVDIVKADDQEAMAIAGTTDPREAARWIASCGVKEVLVTFADRGSFVWADGRGHEIAAVVPEQTVDATGCGDTYGAAYLHARLEGWAVVPAANFAAAAASFKLAQHGPLIASREELARVLGPPFAQG